MKKICLWMVCIFLQTCLSTDPSANLGNPKNQKIKINNKLFLKTVLMRDEYLKSNRFLARQIWIQIYDWMKVNNSDNIYIYGIPEEEQNALTLRIDKWEETSEWNFWFLPLTVLSLGLYPVLGKEIKQDSFRLEGAWIVENFEQEPRIYRFSRTCSENITLYSDSRIPRRIAVHQGGVAGVRCRAQVFNWAFKYLEKNLGTN
jgi:hypothetical protein